jgi:hypothetical protein
MVLSKRFEPDLFLHFPNDNVANAKVTTRSYNWYWEYGQQQGGARGETELRDIHNPMLKN